MEEIAVIPGEDENRSYRRRARCMPTWLLLRRQRRIAELGSPGRAEKAELAAIKLVLAKRADLAERKLRRRSR